MRRHVFRNLFISASVLFVAYATAVNILMIGGLFRGRIFFEIFKQIPFQVSFIIFAPTILLALLLYKSYFSKKYAYVILLIFLPLQFFIYFYILENQSISVYTVNHFMFSMPILFVLLSMQLLFSSGSQKVFRGIDLFFVANYVGMILTIAMLTLFDFLFLYFAILLVLPVWAILNTIGSTVGWVKASDDVSRKHSKRLFFLSIFAIPGIFIFLFILQQAFIDSLFFF